MPDGCDHVKITLTAVQDLANIVVKAVEYEDEWPVIGGIKGCELSIAQIIRLAEDIRGKCFVSYFPSVLSLSLTFDEIGGPVIVEKLKVDDLKAGIVKSTWLPKVIHAAIPPEQADALAGTLLAGMTLGISVGALNVSDEWNRLLPDYKFIQTHQFLSKAWQGKP